MSPSWQIEVDRATSAEWSQMLDQFEDASIYQTAAYGEVHWGRKNLSRLVLRRDGDVVGLAQLRIVRPTPLRFGMAWLRWGPLWERRGQPVDAEVAFRLARAIEEEYVRQRRLFVRILPNAFVGSPRADLFNSVFAKFSREPQSRAGHYRTFVVDLTPSPDQLRAKLDPKWRNKLRQAEKASLTVMAGDGVEEYRAFLNLYAQMRNRKSFDTTVDAEEFARIQEALPPSQRMRVLVALDNGVSVAALIAAPMGHSAIYLLGATGDAGLKSRGAYLLQWTMMGWLRERGIRWYDLGGIDPDTNPGVFYFKRGFSGADLAHIEPLSASDSAVSSGMVRGALALQRAVRAALRPFTAPRTPSQPAVEN
jgi:lipid II:glycine glycyltransferase (peptidoglycan interpeptide bridge formation enzyme)